MPTTFFQRRTKQRETVIVIGIAGFLAACGGGGGVSSAAPEVTNRAPVFDQASYALTIQENTGTIVSGISFSDPDSDPVTLSISGTDSGAFSVTSVRSLAFIVPPDFEAPADSDENNQYDIDLVASDGQLTTSVPVAITVTNDPSDDGVSEGSLFGLSVQVGEVSTPDYDRPSTWDDEDGDCISDRHEVLMAQHLDGDGAYPLVMSANGCFVATGRWLDPYDDICLLYTSDAADE